MVLLQNYSYKVYKKQALHTLVHVKKAKSFKKGQLQGRLKQLNLEQDPGHNTRWKKYI